jgi:diguanylate cyclase (GGDEF)-like protein
MSMRAAAPANLLANALRAALLGTAWLCSPQSAAVIIEGDTATLLARADASKTADHGQFLQLLESLQARAAQLLPGEQEYLQYLQAWQRVYAGDYDAAMAVLSRLSERSSDATLRLRAGGTLTNALALAARYQEALSHLSRLLQQLPATQASDAREQLLGIAAFLYNQVGQYDLALGYAQQIIDDNWSGRGTCKGGEVKAEALYRAGRLPAPAAQYQTTIDACLQIGELLRANIVRTYVAGSLLEQQRFKEALALLDASSTEVETTRYSRLQAEFDALLAEAHRQARNPARARQFALRAIERAPVKEFTQPTVSAYRVLYLLAREQRDFAAALQFHEKYAAADKGYLDAVTARQLAYERARSEAVAARAQVDALNRRNQLLLLKQELDSKAVEASRLYIVLLLTVLISIGLWALRTKRSQLHFRHLSRHDGMTGIANRPHFMDSAQRTLAESAKDGSEVCVVLCDLDHFKSINDRYGHATGDFVIAEVAAVCRRQLNANANAKDIVGRLGGEEFGIVLAGCNAEQGRLWSEQLRLAIAAIATHEAGMATAISASLGVAASATCGYELGSLLNRADAALYQAKRSGRDRTVLFDASLVDAFATQSSRHWAHSAGYPIPVSD